MPEPVTTPVTHTGPTIPHYELLRPIGRGAYGEVWLSRNLTGSWVALKVVSRAAFDHDRPFEGIKRFEPISRSDPSQLAIFHVGRGDGFFYYVMELADQAEGEKEEGGKGAGERTSNAASPPPPFPFSPLLPFSPASYTPKTLKRLLNDRGALPSEECLAIARMGRYEQALAELEKLRPRWNPRALPAEIGMVYAHMGRRAQSS